MLPFQTITAGGFRPSQGSFFGAEVGWHSANFGFYKSSKSNQEDINQLRRSLEYLFGSQEAAEDNSFVEPAY
jgi:hypothetical protein